MSTLQIRGAQADDLRTLVPLWERSVRATHGFLSEEDIEFYRPLVVVIFMAGARVGSATGAEHDGAAVLPSARLCAGDPPSVQTGNISARRGDSRERRDVGSRRRPIRSDG